MIDEVMKSQNKVFTPKTKKRILQIKVMKSFAHMS